MKSKRYSCFVSIVTILLLTLSLSAQTIIGGDTLVKEALDYVVQFSMSPFDENHVYDVDELPNTWAGFIGGNTTNGWTLAMKKNAFASYLVSMASTNGVALSAYEKQLFRAALLQCDVLEFTNCVPAMRILSLNPNGVYRHEAISLCLKYGTISNEMTDYVESIVTNRVLFNLRERSRACGEYAEMIKRLNDDTTAVMLVGSQAIDMLYRQRMNDLIGTKILDELFVSHIQGYCSSSNRLEVATYVIDHPQCQSPDRAYFMGVTNQLISSGQPLRWINVGGNNP